MALEVDPSRKIQLRARGELNLPGTCACCGGDDPERSYVDFGIWYDYEGSVYICSVCFTEATHVIGFFTSEEVGDQLTEMNRLIEENKNMKQELENARPILDAVLSASGNSGAPTAAVTGSDLTLDSEKSDETAQGTDDVTTDGEPEVTELAPSEGRSNSGGTKRGNRSSSPVIS